MHYLHTGLEWAADPQNEIEHRWKDWPAFFAGTSRRLGCSEHCDCYREFPNFIGTTRENR